MSDVLNESRISGGIVRGGSIDGNVEQKNNVNGGEVARNRGGTYDYNILENKPQINSHELIGNQTGNDLGLVDGENEITISEIDRLFNAVFGA